MNKDKEKTKTSKAVFTVRLFNVLLCFLGVEILITYSRKTLNKGTMIEDPVVKYGLYSLLSLILVFYIVNYFLLGNHKQDIKRDTFEGKQDYIFYIIPLAIIVNYLFIYKPITYMTGSLLSDLFDIALVFSCIFIVVFIIILCKRVLYRNAFGSLDTDEKSNSFKPDSPIKDRAEDKLKRDKFTDRIAGCIADQGNESLTIGIFGEWGSGKSSVFEMIKKELSNKMKTSSIIIDFKPWYFGNDNHEIIRTYLFQLIDEIKKDDGFDPKLDKELKKYMEYLSAISFRPAGLIVNLKDFLDKYSPSKDSIKLSEVKKTIEEMLKKSNKRIIVFIDDIDRLDRDEIKMVFKLVRLIADFPNITYLLAIDEDVVSDSLSESYHEKELEHRKSHGRKYLDKFIQLPIYLPKPDPDYVGGIFWEEIEKFLVHKDVKGVNKELLLQHVRHLEFTPRNVNKFINLVMFFLPLLKDEVNPRDLMYLLLIQIKNPKLYKFIRERGYFFTNDLEAEKMDEFRSNSNYFISDFNHYKDILCDIFPYLDRFYDEKKSRINEKTKDKWLLEKRICSTKYFEQYFMYSLPQGEVSHEILELFLKKLTDSNVPFEEMYKEYLNLIEVHAISDVNIKLKGELNNISVEARTHLINIAINLYADFYLNNDKKTETDSLFYLIWLISVTIINNLESTNLMKFDNHVNLFLLVKIFIYLENSDEDTERLNILKSRIQLLYQKSLDVKLINELNIADAKFMLQSWDRFMDSKQIKVITSNWFNDEEVLEGFLKVTFEHEANLKNEEQLISSFVSSSKYMPDTQIKKIFDIKSPSSENELMMDKKSTKYPLTGEFIYAKNRLFDFVTDKLREIEKVGKSNNQYIGKPKLYIQMGIDLINRYGENSQKNIIENIAEETAEYNSDLTDHLEMIEKTRRELSDND
ncbi:KAP family P-loop NTPase fold protein [Paenibacillus sinopodophylli]|uniref:KAP family P-loop NTPase fold protein n=1 Tax=Paenibacillus sinopodophylli TaxID=1837342 RepID=UPI00110CD863|nr:P-loop NTPase fold protein [Paenibacillus sinopodophylli]